MIVKGLLETAVELHRAGQLAEALELYRKVLADDPGNIDALHLAGVALNRLGDHQGAVAHIERAVQAGPSQAHMLFNLGNAYRFAGRLDDAVAAYRRAVNQDPAMESAWSGLAESQVLTGTLRTLVVTSSDTGYFPLARDLVLSLRQNGPIDLCFDIAFLDSGCDGNETGMLRDLGVAVRHVTDGPAPKIPGQPLYTMAQTCRPYLPAYFPGYDVYIWLDADIWIQKPDAIGTLVQQAIKMPRGVVAVREIDSGYVTQNRSSAAQAYFSDYHSRCAEFCPTEILGKMLMVPQFNCGVFAMHVASAGWGAWARFVDRFLANGYFRMFEQYAFNAAIAEIEKVVNLPATYNWISSQCTPFRNEFGKVCKPYFPYEELSVVHLTATSQTFEGIKFLDLYRQRRLLFERSGVSESVTA